VDYVEYEGNGWAAAAHLDADRPRAGFSERYIRCAKALVLVDGAAADLRDPGAGLPLEIIALDNPFRPGAAEVRVRLVWQGAPVSDLQISIFEGGNPVTRALVRTGPDGTARIPGMPGRRYLLSAVRLEQLPDTEDDDWQSHWASLAFETPKR